MGLSDKNRRFVKVYEEGGMLNCFSIVIDKATGVNYILHSHGDGESMTPLLAPDGRPVVTPIYDNDLKR